MREKSSTGPAPKIHHVPPYLLKSARKLRQTQTDAENLMWLLLRNRRLGGLKFRRQYPVAGFVLDFYCEAARLAIELDGGQHGELMQADALRSAALARQGMTVLRFWNHEVLQETEAVLTAIWNAVLSDVNVPAQNTHSSAE